MNSPTPHKMGKEAFSSRTKQSGGAATNGAKDLVIKSIEDVFKEKPPKMNAPLMADEAAGPRNCFAMPS
jgi:hypothetical protein